MTHLPPSPSRHRLAVLAAAFGLAVLAAPAAQAFTIDNQGNSNTDGTARYTDPDARFSGSGDGQTVIRQGNTTLQFRPGAVVRSALQHRQPVQSERPSGRRSLNAPQIG